MRTWARVCVAFVLQFATNRAAAQPARQRGVPKNLKNPELSTLPFSAFTPAPDALGSFCHHDHSSRIAWLWTSATPWHPPRSRHGTLSKRAPICASLVRLWVSLSLLFGLVPPRSFERHVSCENFRPNAECARVLATFALRVLSHLRVVLLFFKSAFSSRYLKHWVFIRISNDSFSHAHWSSNIPPLSPIMKSSHTRAHQAT
jgi:hypothetical protein